MSSTINASTASGGGIITSADASGILALQTAGTTAVTIDASQNVGIGTSSPKRSLSINGGLAFQTPGGASRAIHWGDETTNIFPVTLSAGTLVGNEYFSIGTNVFGSPATERMRIDSSGNLLFNSGYGSVATAYGCRAWVNFNGTGTVAIRASGNVSSITDNGTGNYTVNFTTAMPDVNYSAVFGVCRPSPDTNAAGVISSLATGSAVVLTGQPSTALAQDFPIVCVSIFR